MGAPDGRLVVSTHRLFHDHDDRHDDLRDDDPRVQVFTATSLGSTSRGTFTPLMAIIGIGQNTNTNEYIDGLWLDAPAGELYLKPSYNYLLWDGTRGKGNEILRCPIYVADGNRACSSVNRFWDGSDYGIGAISAAAIRQPRPVPGTIGGQVFLDASYDGQFNGSDSTWADVAVTLWTKLGALKITPTNAAGTYSFTTDPSHYSVHVAPQPGYSFTYNRGPEASDSDGISDDKEDLDGDGLDNITEVGLRTDPLLADTDGDSLSDGMEVNSHGSDPLQPDTDNDGLTDDSELRLNTNPRDGDSNNNGLPDGQETYTTTATATPGNAVFLLTGVGDVAKHTDVRVLTTDTRFQALAGQVGPAIRVTADRPVTNIRVTLPYQVAQVPGSDTGNLEILRYDEAAGGFEHLGRDGKDTQLQRELAEVQERYSHDPENWSLSEPVARVLDWLKDPAASEYFKKTIELRLTKKRKRGADYLAIGNYCESIWRKSAS